MDAQTAREVVNAWRRMDEAEKLEAAYGDMYAYPFPPDFAGENDHPARVERILHRHKIGATKMFAEGAQFNWRMSEVEGNHLRLQVAAHVMAEDLEPKTYRQAVDYTVEYFYPRSPWQAYKRRTAGHDWHEPWRWLIGRWNRWFPAVYIPGSQTATRTVETTVTPMAVYPMAYRAIPKEAYYLHLPESLPAHVWEPNQGEYS